MRLVFFQVLVALSLLASCGDLGAGPPAPTAVAGRSGGQQGGGRPLASQTAAGPFVAFPTGQTARLGDVFTPTPPCGVLLVSLAQLTPAENGFIIRLRVGDQFVFSLDAAPVAPPVPINATSTTLAPLRP